MSTTICTNIQKVVDFMIVPVIRAAGKSPADYDLEAIACDVAEWDKAAQVWRIAADNDTVWESAQAHLGAGAMSESATYTTIADVIDEIVETLEAGIDTYGGEFDIEAIASDITEWDEAAQALRITADDDEFWESVKTHQLTTYEAVLAEAEPIITIHVPGSEDTDIAVIDGVTVSTVIDYPASEVWEPEVYDAALAEAGWKRVNDWTDPECIVVRAD